MTQINRIGTFKGVPVDSGVGESSGGFPQWIAQLQAAFYYDEETEQWIDWSEYVENEITAYCVLFGGDGNPTLTAKQLQKALGWSGTSFSELAESDYSATVVQFRVEERTWEGNTRLQVVWIDHKDAEPGRTIQKLDAAEVKQLDAKYANSLRKLGGAPKPKAVPQTAPAPGTAAEKKAAAQAAAKAKRGRPRKPQPPVSQPQTEPEPEPEPESDSCTKDEAWEACYTGKAKSVSDTQLGEIWLKAVESQGDENKFTDEDWAVVRNIVLEQVKDEIPF